MKRIFQRTGKVKEQHEPGEAGEPAGAPELRGDGGREREEATAHEAVEDRERQLSCVATGLSGVHGAG